MEIGGIQDLPIGKIYLQNALNSLKVEKTILMDFGICDVYTNWRNSEFANRQNVPTIKNIIPKSIEFDKRKYKFKILPRIIKVQHYLLFAVYCKLYNVG